MCQQGLKDLRRKISKRFSLCGFPVEQNDGGEDAENPGAGGEGERFSADQNAEQGSGHRFDRREDSGPAGFGGL